MFGDLMNRQDFLTIIITSFRKWQKHDASLRAAALTYFMIMPLPSLMLIAVAILAQIYGQTQALQQLIHQITTVAGSSVADLVSQILKSAQGPFTSVFGSFIGVVFALAGAIGAFSVLQKSINAIWETRPDEMRSSLRENVGHFFLISAVGLMVIVWTALSTVFFSVLVIILEPVVGSLAPTFLRGAQVLLSFGLGTLLFAVIFKRLPEKEIRWGDVALAAVITGLVFTILNYVFGVYLSLFPVTTLAGAAGSLMLLLLWIYLTNLSVLFGVQFSKVYAEKSGSISKSVKVEPEKRSERKGI
jgi:membrane protein